ncbi:MAG TPA: dienelactone hydrolase family protein [Acidimicrobiia bacterium]|nr:dienelactone hydrolase family protein [Acidimicrobiia bacterium]
MAEIMVYHHAQGLTLGVAAFADTLRGAGHTVHVPDLYDGRTFATLDEGMAYLREVGFQSILDAGVTATEDLPVDLVYIGFSLGVVPAQQLAQTRPGARGAVLCYSCLPISEFGGGSWPAGTPVQIHGMGSDPYFADEGDLDAARELVASTDNADLFVYPGSEHLFADSSLASYDSAAAALMTDRILAFLRGLS